MVNIEDLIYINNKSISPEICSDIITLFENDKRQYQGTTSLGVNVKYKNTTDLLMIHGDPQWDKINKLLTKELACNINAFIKPFYNTFYPEHTTIQNVSHGIMQIQKYNKNVGKFLYHHDFLTKASKKEARMLTYIWYLNDVYEGGETEFWKNIESNPKLGNLYYFLHAGPFHTLGWSLYQTTSILSLDGCGLSRSK